MARFDLRTRTVVTLLVLALAAPGIARAADDFADLEREIAKRHDEAVKRLQDWIALPSIAAESLNSAAGAERMAQLSGDPTVLQRELIALQELLARREAALFGRSSESRPVPKPALSMIRASSGGDDHSAGSNCFTSYMK